VIFSAVNTRVVQLHKTLVIHSALMETSITAVFSQSLYRNEMRADCFLVNTLPPCAVTDGNSTWVREEESCVLYTFSQTRYNFA
jgi:hypothetical protein